MLAASLDGVAVSLVPAAVKPPGPWMTMSPLPMDATSMSFEPTLSEYTTVMVSCVPPPKLTSGADATAAGRLSSISTAPTSVRMPCSRGKPVPRLVGCQTGRVAAGIDGGAAGKRAVSPRGAAVGGQNIQLSRRAESPTCLFVCRCH